MALPSYPDIHDDLGLHYPHNYAQKGQFCMSWPVCCIAPDKPFFLQPIDFFELPTKAHVVSTH